MSEQPDRPEGRLEVKQLYLFVPITEQSDLFDDLHEEVKARMLNGLDRKFREKLETGFPQIEPHTESVIPSIDTMIAQVRKIEQSFKKAEVLRDIAAETLFPLAHIPGLRPGDIEVYVYTAPESDPVSSPGSGYAVVTYKGEWVGELRSW